MRPTELPLEETTPVTEAIENSVDEGVRSATDVSYQLQRAISLATTGGSAAEYVTQVSRLGVSVLRGVVTAWSTAVDGLGLIAADRVEWWWTRELKLTFPRGAEVRGVARAAVVSVPHRRQVPPRWVRVAHRAETGGEPRFIDRGTGVPRGWDRTCHVMVRQHADFIPSAVVVTVTMLDEAGRTLATGNPVDAILSLA
jgi:hypothetical protein